MKRILTILAFVLPVFAFGQVKDTVLLKNGFPREVADTNSVKSVIDSWGDSMTQGAGASGDSTYPVLLQGMSGYFVKNDGVGGETSIQIKSRYDAAAERRSWNIIWWAGRNNYADSAQVVSDAIAAYNLAKAIGNERFLVVSICNAGGEPSGSAAFINIQKCNTGLAKAFPGRFIYLRDSLVALYNPSIPADVANHSQDIIPLSLRSDSIHLNSRGYYHVARIIYGKFTQLLGNKVLTQEFMKGFLKTPMFNTNNKNLFMGTNFRTDSTGRIGLGAATRYTHSINLGSTDVTPGIRWNNTTDDSTNYEYVEQRWIGNVFYTIARAGGTGTTSRSFRREVGGGYDIFGIVSTAGFYQLFRNLTGGNSSLFGMTGTHNSSSGSTNVLSVINTVSTTGSAGWKGIWVSPYVTSLGSGETYLLALGVNSSATGAGTHRRKFDVDTTGNVVAAGNGSFAGYVTSTTQPSGDSSNKAATMAALDKVKDSIASVIPAVLTQTTTLDFPSTAAGTVQDLTTTVTGAALGDPVTVGKVGGYACCDSTAFVAFVSSANTVTVRFLNMSGSPIDPAADNYRIKVMK